MNQRVILHVDFDYFYAQCEEIRTPDLKTKPVAVCMFSDRGGDSGAIATANYTVREFGVKSCLSIQYAKQISGPDSTILIVGSLYAASEARAFELELTNETKEKTK